MDNKKIEKIINFGQENRYVEFKCSISWDDIKYKIAKTCLAMSNISTGGHIIIGMKWDDIKKKYIDEGVTEEQIKSYKLKHDVIQEFVNKYADPSVNLNSTLDEVNSKNFIVIRVYEFEQIPIFCKKDGENNLRNGEIYTRSSKKPESAKVSSQNDMREIIEIAVDKQLPKLLKRFGFTNISSETDIQRKESAKKFNNEAGEF